MIALNENQPFAPFYGWIKYDDGSEEVKGFKSWLAATRWFKKQQRECTNYEQLHIANQSNCITL